jgi:UDPglucose 6-dehydrogenase
MKISLANQLHLVASKLGADSSRIMDCVGSDPRIGHAYLIPGRPYEGPCLPRDNRMFRFVAESVGVNAALSEAADKINQAIGTPSPRASSA